MADPFTPIPGESLHPGGLELSLRAVSLLDLPVNAAVLDVGCGCGATLQSLSQRELCHCFGVDVSMRLLAQGHPESFSDCSPHTAQAAGEHLPFATETFDALLMECCLASTSRPLFVLSEAVRVLNAGGKLVLNDLYRRIPSPAVHVPSDLRQIPTQAEYFDMLRATGMEILRWEDHSAALRTYAARWVWGHGRDALPPGLEGFCAAGRPWSDEFRRQTPGYAMLLALKPVQRQVKMRYP